MRCFNCPHCGAPGHVEYGEAKYTCLCRFGDQQSVEGARNFVVSIPYAEPTTLEREQGCKPAEPLTEKRVREIANEELNRRLAEAWDYAQR